MYVVWCMYWFCLIVCTQNVIFVLNLCLLSSDVTAMTVVLKGDKVSVEGSYLHVPPLNTTEDRDANINNCLSNYSVHDFKCLLDDGSDGDILEEEDFRMQVLLAGRDGLTVASGVQIDAPAIEGTEVGGGFACLLVNLNFVMHACLQESQDVDVVMTFISVLWWACCRYCNACCLVVLLFFHYF
jgi:hypothetical protein